MRYLTILIISPHLNANITMILWRNIGKYLENMPSTSFPPYPPAQKPKSKKEFMTMVSNISARKKWLIKYVPEWNGGEVWSEKQVKRYIENMTKHKFLPLAREIKIPYAWNWQIILVLDVVEPSERPVAEPREYRMNQISSLYSSQVPIDFYPTIFDSMLESFISHMERYDAFME